MAAPFKNTGNKGSKSAIKTVAKTNSASKSPIAQATNRPQGAIKVMTNGGAATFKNTRNNENPDHRKIQRAQSSSATPAKSGNRFGKFIGQ